MTYTNRQIEQTGVFIPTPDGQMPAFLFTHPEDGQKPAVLLLMEAFGLTPHIQDNDIHPVEDAKFMLDQIQAAFEYLEKGQQFNKVVITL